MSGYGPCGEEIIAAKRTGSSGKLRWCFKEKTAIGGCIRIGKNHRVSVDFEFCLLEKSNSVSFTQRNKMPPTVFQRLFIHKKHKEEEGGGLTKMLLKIPDKDLCS